MGSFGEWLGTSDRDGDEKLKQLKPLQPLGKIVKESKGHGDMIQENS